MLGEASDAVDGPSAANTTIAASSAARHERGTLARNDIDLNLWKILANTAPAEAHQGPCCLRARLQYNSPRARIRPCPGELLRGIDEVRIHRRRFDERHDRRDKGCAGRSSV